MTPTHDLEGEVVVVAVDEALGEQAPLDVQGTLCHDVLDAEIAEHDQVARPAIVVAAIDRQVTIDQQCGGVVDEVAVDLEVSAMNDPGDVFVFESMGDHRSFDLAQDTYALVGRQPEQAGKVICLEPLLGRQSTRRCDDCDEKE